MWRGLTTFVVASALAATGCGAEDGATELSGDSRCSDLARLPAETQAQAVLRVSDHVGAAHSGNPLWLGQIATYCSKRPEATLRAAFGRGDSEPEAGPVTQADDEATAFVADRSYRWDTRSDSGGTATVTLELGEVTRAGEGVPEQHAELTGICDVDAERDAFVPVRITVRNTTDGFSLSPSVTLRLNNVESRFDATVRVDAANDFSDGPQCDALTDGSIDDGTGVGFGDLAPEGEDSHDSLLVLHDYYTPAYPDGDDVGLGEWYGSVHVREETSSMGTDCFDAPSDRYAFTGGFLRLGGALSPGFPLADQLVDRNPDGDDDPPRCADSNPANDAPTDSPMPRQDAVCRELNTRAEVTTTRTRLGATRRTYDRGASLAQVCWGFGAPEEVKFSPGMQCAMVAAAATYASLPAKVTARRTCTAVAVQQALETGDWAGEAASAGCGVFAEVFAGAVGIVAGAAAAPTGPGAAAVGRETYRAFSAGLTLACGGLFDGGAEAFGTKLEADHQRNVAADILEHGKCLQQTTLRGLTQWSAADCP
jgi:hypothetical protein